MRSRWAKIAVFLICLAPLAYLARRYYNDDLTANPIEYITHFTGNWALRFLLITLAITPLRKLLHAPDLIRYRRMLGLYAFFYASLHFATWFGLDKGFDMHEILRDFVKRRFIIAGLTALLCMLPLAVTSTRGWIRRMGGKRWQMLHRLIYLSACAVVIHYYWLVKSDKRLPLMYGAILTVLLGYRLMVWLLARRAPAPVAPKSVAARP